MDGVGGGDDWGLGTPGEVGREGSVVQPDGRGRE